MIGSGRTGEEAAFAGGGRVFGHEGALGMMTVRGVVVTGVVEKGVARVEGREIIEIPRHLAFL